MTFRLQVENTGTTDIVTLPLSQDFSSCLALDSASVSPSSSGAGTLLWDDLGPLAQGASLTVDVVFSAEGACDPATVTSDVSFAVDANGDAVPGTTSEIQLTIDPLVPIGESFFVHEDANEIYAIDLQNGTSVLLGTTSATGNMNALAYDDVNGASGTLWYTDNVSYELYRFDVAAGSEVGVVGDLGASGWTDPVTGGRTDGGAWFDGAYYVGTEGSDNIWRVTFNGTFTAIDDVVKLADTKFDTGTNVWGDFIISSSGVLYGVENGQVFSFDLNTDGPLSVITSGAMITGLQIGGDGLLYGIASEEAGAPLYQIDLSTNTLSLHVSTGLATGPGDMAGPVAADPVGTVTLGNLIFDDFNGDGVFDSGSETGLDGVTVQLFRQGQVSGVDTPVDATVTSGGGFYQFETESGSYYVHVPASEFAAGAALEGYRSSPGYAIDQTADDDADENGVDVPAPDVSGVNSVVMSLRLGTMPLSSGGAATETGAGGGTDDFRDSHGNLTLDLGFTTGSFGGGGVTSSGGVSNLYDCYLASDEGMRLTGFDLVGNAEYDVGSLGLPDVEALEFDPVEEKLYGAAGGTLVEINRGDGTATLVGEFSPSGVTTPNGSLGAIAFDDVDGLARDSINGRWFGVARVDGNVSGGRSDVLFQFDPSTGAYLAGAFAGDDYVAIQKVDADRHLIDDLAFEPLTHTLYGVANGNGTFNATTAIVQIDPATGGVTNLGEVFYDPDGLGAAPAVTLGDVEGLTVSLDGDLLGVTGANGDHPQMIFLLEGAGGGGVIDATKLNDIGFGDLYTDYEAISCGVYVNAGEVSGTIYHDFDGNGVFGGTDFGLGSVQVELTNAITGTVLATAFTDNQGDYHFAGLPSGSYRVKLADGNFGAMGLLEGFNQTFDPDGNLDGQATYQAVAVPESGISGVISFDGDGDYGETKPPGQGGFGSSKGPFTISAWVYPGLAHQSGGIVGTGDGNSPEEEFIMQEGDQFVFQFGSSSDRLVSQTRITAGSWYHVAGVFDGSALHFYVNGREEASKVTTQKAFHSNWIKIGRVWTGSGVYYFEGALDAVSYWDAALNAVQLRRLAFYGATGIETGINSYWDWDQNTASNDGWDYVRSDYNMELFGDASRGAIIEPSTGELDFGYSTNGKSGSYAAWLSEFEDVLGGQRLPDDNYDGDLHTNLLEYALCLHPGTGVSGPGGFFVVPSDDGLNVDAVFYRAAGGLPDVTYKLDALAELPLFDFETWDIIVTVPGTGAPPAGVTVTDLGGAIEEVRIHDIDTMAPLSADKGFVRLTVDLDDGANVGSSYTDVHGWKETLIEGGHTETFASPFMKSETLSGEITGLVNARGLKVTRAAGNYRLENVLDFANRDYYVEIIAGDHVGHRFDVATAGGDVLTLATDGDVLQGPPYSTMVTSVDLPSTLAGARFVLREHYSLEDYFSTEAPFTGQLSNSDPDNPADNVFFYTGSGWEVYWLFDNGGGVAQWVAQGDITLADKGSRVIAPGEGLFLAKKGADVAMLTMGVVRKNDFCRPLPLGYSLVAPGFPLDQSALDRVLTPLDFDGNADPELSDRFYDWNGDKDTYEPAYRGFFLLENVVGEATRWVALDDEFMRSVDFDSALFPQDRSSFYYRANTAFEGYIMRLPWCIGLIGE